MRVFSKTTLFETLLEIKIERNMNRISAYLFTILVLFILTSTDVFACSCVEPTYGESLSVQVKRAKMESDAVFTGKILAITENTEESYTTVKLKVIDSWKGNLSKEITILTGLHDGNCRYSFAVGKTYLIYGYHGSMYSSGKSLETNICTRTTLISEAKAEMKILGKRKKLTS